MHIAELSNNFGKITNTSSDDPKIRWKDELKKILGFSSNEKTGWMSEKSALLSNHRYDPYAPKKAQKAQGGSNIFKDIIYIRSKQL